MGDGLSRLALSRSAELVLLAARGSVAVEEAAPEQLTAVSRQAKPVRGARAKPIKTSAVNTLAFTALYQNKLYGGR